MAAPPPAREPHALALKVLRTARPSLVPSATPYYEDDSLGGGALRELELHSVSEGRDHGLSGALQLPNAFGTIYLGETFSAILSLSNDWLASPNPSTIASAPQLKVEMHTSGPPNAPPGTGGLKHLLQTISAPNDQLAPGQSVEGLVSHEIKELGMHSLVCTVTYAVSSLTEGGPRTVSRSFRKVYKFAVSNPLSVRTKAHSPNSLVATSSLSPTEKHKVFLEVQVQNNAEEAMSFERMRFEPVAGWTMADVNEDLFAGTEALLHPGGVRQFVFVLLASPRVPYVEPGGSQGLGRLDIVWRTPHGEMGRLQTSMLGRRVPIPPAPLNLPAVLPPPADKPLPPPARSTSPVPYASNSPIKTPAPYRPAHAPGAPSAAAPTSNLPAPETPRMPDATALNFELLVESISPERIVCETPFEVAFALKIRDLTPSNGLARKLRVAAQHVQWSSATGIDGPPPVLDGPAAIVLPSSTRAPPPPSSPVPPLQTSLESAQPFISSSGSSTSIILPPPYPLLAASTPTPGPRPSREVLRLGNGLVHLDEVVLAAPPPTTPSGADAPTPPSRRSSATARFRMRFLPTEAGLMRAGGLRILLLESSESGGVSGKVVDDGRESSARVVLEHEVIAEVWVSSSPGA